MQSALLREQSTLQTIYPPPLDKYKHSISISKGYQLFTIWSQNQNVLQEEPLLVLPPNVIFRKEDWEAIGRKFGFLNEQSNMVVLEKGKEETNNTSFEVAEVRLDKKKNGCSLMLNEHIHVPEEH